MKPDRADLYPDAAYQSEFFVKIAKGNDEPNPFELVRTAFYLMQR